MARRPFTYTIERAVPPWLLRSVGGRFMRAIAEQLDALVDRLVEGVALRLPGGLGAIEPTALALTGRERRIRRGPSEDATTYARRLRLWWDSHSTRGGPYALLEQLRAYFLDWLPVRTDVVYYSGTRRWMDADGVITRDAITWDASGPEAGATVVAAMNAAGGDTSIYLGFHSSAFPDSGGYTVRVWDLATDPVGETVEVVSQTADGHLMLATPLAGPAGAATAYSSPRVARTNVRWAHVWLFLYVPDSITIGTDYLVTSDGDYIVTSDGDRILVTRTISPDEITPDEEAIFTAVPREWNAAHVPYITVVLLWSTRRLWNYPQPVPTWAEWGASGALWGDSPVMLRAE